jgi:hypothetical protein
MTMSTFYLNQKFSELDIIPNLRNVSLGVRTLEVFLHSKGQIFHHLDKSWILTLYSKEEYSQLVHNILSVVMEMAAKSPEAANCLSIEDKFLAIDKYKFDFMEQWQPEIHIETDDSTDTEDQA